MGIDRRTLIGLFGFALAGVEGALMLDNANAAQAQRDAMKVAPDSEMVTAGFEAMAAKHPWLDNIRHGIAATYSTVGTQLACGSAMLLDHDGTIAMTAHQNMGKDMYILFPQADGTYVKIIPSDFMYDTAHDIMFASIDPGFIPQYGLTPVRLAQTGHAGSKIPRDVVGVGYCGQLKDGFTTLHAAAGKIKTFEETVDTTIGQRSCQMQTSTPLYHGSSGGGYFSNGLCVGIVNSGNEMFGRDAKNNFTTADVVADAYAQVYPARAAKTFGGTLPVDTAKPAECAVNRRSFLRGFTS